MFRVNCQLAAPLNLKGNTLQYTCIKMNIFAKMMLSFTEKELEERVHSTQTQKYYYANNKKKKIIIIIKQKNNTTLPPCQSPSLLSLLPLDTTSWTKGEDLDGSWRCCRCGSTTTTKKRVGMFRHRLLALNAWPNVLGNILLPLLFLLLSMVMVVAESFSQLPDGNGQLSASQRTGSTLNRIVDDWLNESKRPAVEGIYGPIKDWDVSLVTNMQYLFGSEFIQGRTRLDPQSQLFLNINPDISKWDVSRVNNMQNSKFFFVYWFFSFIF